MLTFKEYSDMPLNCMFKRKELKKEEDGKERHQTERKKEKEEK